MSPPPKGPFAQLGSLIPSVHPCVLSISRDFCILVQLVPRLVYYLYGELLDRWDGYYCTKQEPITALTVSLLLGLGTAGVATGTSSLVLQGKSYQELRAVIDLDTERIEESITHFQESLPFLSEVGLQNHYVLDLLFLQQGGL